MALQTFTSGQVLTAAQVTALQTNDFNQTVSTKTASYTLVALDKGTRVVMNSASATTITVNTSLFNAGDTLQIHNIGVGVCTITAGTATVSTAGSLALAVNAGGTLFFTSAGVAIFFPTVAGSSASGLELINTTSFSGVASQVINNCFSATYNNYRILYEATASANSLLNYRLRVGGVNNTTASSYSHQRISHFNTSITGSQASNNIGIFGVNKSSATEPSTVSVDIFNPFLTKPTTYTCHNAEYSDEQNLFCGSHNQSVSFDGFEIIASAGNITGSITVMGYNV